MSRPSTLSASFFVEAEKNICQKGRQGLNFTIPAKPPAFPQSVAVPAGHTP